MFSRWPAYFFINVYVSLKSTLHHEADQRICENVKFIKSALTAFFSFVKLLWMTLQTWLLVRFQILYVPMYGYNSTATGFAVGDMRGAAHDWAHVSGLQQFGGPKSDPNSKPDLNYIICKIAVSEIQCKMQRPGRWLLGVLFFQ